MAAAIQIMSFKRVLNVNYQVKHTQCCREFGFQGSVVQPDDINVQVIVSSIFNAATGAMTTDYFIIGRQQSG